MFPRHDLSALFDIAGRGDGYGWRGLCYGCFGDERILVAVGIDDFVEARTAHFG